MITRDTYYRGYRLSIANEGRASQTVHIVPMGEDVVLSYVPTIEVAKSVIDGWLNAA